MFDSCLPSHKKMEKVSENNTHTHTYPKSLYCSGDYVQTAHYSFHLKFHELPVFAKSNHSTVSVVMLTCNVPPQLFTNLSRADGFAQFARDASLLSWRVAPESMLTTETGWERTFLKGVVDSGWLFEKVTKGNAKSCTIQDKVEKVKQRIFCANLLNEYQIRLKKKEAWCSVNQYTSIINLP